MHKALTSSSKMMVEKLCFCTSHVDYLIPIFLILMKRISHLVLWTQNKNKVFWRLSLTLLWFFVQTQPMALQNTQSNWLHWWQSTLLEVEYCALFCCLTTHFFDDIKSRVGQLHPKVFMTDDAGAYWNAFSKVMNGKYTKRLFCIWHVDKSWRKQLCAKVKDQTERGKLYKQLCLLRLQEDQTNFGIMMENFVSRSKKSTPTKDFGIYFENEYSKKTKLWAACYRLHSYINTNMY